MARLTCPECAARITISDLAPSGKRVRCQDCGARFDPSAADPDPDPDGTGREPAKRPRKSGKKRAGRSGALIAVLLIGGGVALLLAVGLIVVGVVLLLPGSGSWGLPGLGPSGLFAPSRVTVENFNKLAQGMSVSQAESILGPGKVCTIGEIVQVGDASHEAVPALNGTPAALGDESSWRRWQNGGLDVFVGFRKGKSGVERVCCYSFVNELPGGAVETESQADNPLEDLDAMAAARSKNEQLVNNPCWKTGPAIRAALVGKWRFTNGGPGDDRTGWDFGADGTCVHYGGFGQDSVAPGRYRFVDDSHIETVVSQPDFFPGKPPTQVTEQFKVLVDDKELVLVYDSPNGPSPMLALSRQP
jgi:predicted Zn finger-like uncharacterized protein